MKHVLVIEDDPGIVELVQFNLEQAGYRVTSAGSGPAGLAQAQNEAPDLVLLDIMLPGLNGKDICRQLRSCGTTKHTPVIMLSAFGDEADRVVGLEIGADDYITKPFSVRELVARVGAILRRLPRPESQPEPAISYCGNLAIDSRSHQVTRNRKAISLTNLEYEMLAFLARHPGRTFTRRELIARIWPKKKITQRSVDTYMLRLRRKVESDSLQISTVRGIGYQLCA